MYDTGTRFALAEVTASKPLKTRKQRNMDIGSAPCGVFCEHCETLLHHGQRRLSDTRDAIQLEREINRITGITAEAKLADDVARLMQLKLQHIRDLATSHHIAMSKQVAHLEDCCQAKAEELLTLERRTEKARTLAEGDDDAIDVDPLSKVQRIEAELRRVEAELNAADGTISVGDRKIAAEGVGGFARALKKDVQPQQAKANRPEVDRTRKAARVRPTAKKINATTPDGILEQIVAHIDAQKSSYMSVFRKYDRDSSGELDKQEFAHVLRELNIAITREQLSKVIQFLDQDGDGSVSIKEFSSKLKESKRKARAEAARTPTPELMMMKLDNETSVPSAHTFHDVEQITGRRRYGLARRAMQELLANQAMRRAQDRASIAKEITAKVSQPHNAELCMCGGCKKARDAVWFEVVDETSGLPYYVNRDTSVTRWKDPRKLGKYSSSVKISGVPRWLSQQNSQQKELLNLPWDRI
jgi:hypothetical protein